MAPIFFSLPLILVAFCNANSVTERHFEKEKVRSLFAQQALSSSPTKRPTSLPTVLKVNATVVDPKKKNPCSITPSLAPVRDFTINGHAYMLGVGNFTNGYINEYYINAQRFGDYVSGVYSYKGYTCLFPDGTLDYLCKQKGKHPILITEEDRTVECMVVEKSKDPNSRMTTVWLSGKGVRRTIPPGSSALSIKNVFWPNYYPGTGSVPYGVQNVQNFNLEQAEIQSGHYVWRNKYIDRTGTGHFTALLSPGGNTYTERFLPNPITVTDPTYKLYMYSLMQQQLDTIPQYDQFGKPTAGQPLPKKICLAKDAFNLDASYVVIDGTKNLIQWVDAVSGLPSGPVIPGTAANMGHPPNNAVKQASNGIVSGYKNFTKGGDYLTYQFLS